MANEIIVGIRFDPKTGELKSELKKAGDNAGKAGKRAGNKFEKGFSDGVKGLTGKVASLGAVLAAAFTFKGAANAVKSIEQIETRLTILTGSAVLATRALNDLKEFSAATPFQLEGLAETTAGLLSFGFSVTEAQENLRAIADVAAGSGSDIKDIGLIFGQVSAAGKLTGERLLQLQERAIPIGPAIAKTLGIAESGVREAVSKSLVNFDKFEQAFKSLSAEGGIFFNAIDKQSKTLGGVISTLADNFFLFQTSLGETFKPAIINSANELIGLFQQFSKSFKENGPVLTRVFDKIAEVLVITPSKFWLDLFAGDAALSLQEVNSQITKLEPELEKLSEIIQENRDSVIANSFFGNQQQNLQRFGELAAQLSDLKKLRDELTAAAAPGETPAASPTLPNGEDSAFTPEGFSADKAVQEVQRLEEAVGGASITLDAGFAQIGLGLSQTASSVVKTSKAISQALKSAFVTGLSGAIQKLATNLANGKSLFDDFGNFVLNLIGDLAIKIGQTTVASGVAISALGSLSPAASIAAGSALIAIGSIIKAFAGNGGAGAIGGAGGGAAGGGDFTTSEPAFSPNDVEQQQDQTIVGITIQGDVLDSDESGLRIVDIINNAFDKQGVTIKQGTA